MTIAQPQDFGSTSDSNGSDSNSVSGFAVTTGVGGTYTFEPNSGTFTGFDSVNKVSSYALNDAGSVKLVFETVKTGISAEFDPMSGSIGSGLRLGKHVPETLLKVHAADSATGQQTHVFDLRSLYLLNSIEPLIEQTYIITTSSGATQTVILSGGASQVINFANAGFDGIQYFTITASTDVEPGGETGEFDLWVDNIVLDNISPPDYTAPIVQSVVLPPNGTYQEGDGLQFTVTFSEDVTVVGTPQVAIVIGDQTVYADYVSGSGASLTFQYVIQAGQVDLDGISVVSLRTNGGTIKDAARNDANLALGGAIPTTAGVRVDAKPPEVLSIVRNGSETTSLDEVTFTITFSEDVIGVSTDDFVLTLMGTAGGSISAVTGSGSTYVVTVSGVSGDGRLRLDLMNSGAGIADASGNPISGGFTSGQSYMIDRTAPTIDLSASIPGDGETAVQPDSNITLHFSEAVFDGGSGRVVVYNGQDGTIIEDFFNFSPTITGWGTRAITLDPSNPLPHGKNLVVKWFGSIFTDEAGNPVAENTSDTLLNFTVADPNDAPEASNLTQTKTVTEDGAGITLDPIVVTDPDHADTITATLTLSDPSAASLSTGSYGTATSTFDAQTGVWSVTGSVADVNAALAAVTVTLRSNYDRSFTINTSIRDAAGTGPADGTIAVVVTPVNDGPLVSVQPGITILEDTPTVLTGISFSDIDAGSNLVTVMLSVPVGTLWADSGSGVMVGGTASFMTLSGTIANLNNFIAGSRISYTPPANDTAMHVLTVSITDGGNVGSGGSLTDTKIIYLNISPVNDAPVAADDVLAPIPEDNGAYVISFASLLANDSAGPMQESDQMITISGVSAAMGGTVSIVGNSVVFVPNPDYYGPASFTYVVQDNGTTNGVSDPKTSVGTVSFFVNPIADTPIVANVTTSEDALSGVIVIGPNAVDGFEVTHFKITEINGGSLYLSDGVTAVAAGTFITVAQAQAGLTLQPAANFSGQASFKVQGSLAPHDAGLGGTPATATITVTPVNDAPTSADATVTLPEDVAYAFTLNDFTFADALDAPTHTLAAITIESLPTRGTLLIDGSAVTVGQAIPAADIAAGKLVFMPFANEHGNGSQYSGFTFRVKDNGGTADGGVDISETYEMRIDVIPVSDPAVIGGTAAGSVSEDGTLLASGVLTVSDLDGSAEAGFQAQVAVQGTYGTFSFDHTTGEWSYALDNASAAVQALKEGETRQESFTVRSIDGTPATVTVTINGAKDADVIDGVEVNRTETNNADGSVSQVVVIPVVTNGRTETDGAAGYADVPLVTQGGRNLLTVQLGAGIGLTATGFAAPRAASDSLTDLIRAIQDQTVMGSADQSTLTGGGTGFLQGLAGDAPLLVQTLTPVLASGSSLPQGVPLVISGNSAAGTPAAALVIDAGGLPAGTHIQLQNVEFAAIIGSVRVSGGAGSQVVFGDSASQHIELGADDDTLHGGAGDDYVGSLGGNDWLYGDDGNDTVSGGSGHDRLFGGNGNDRLLGGTGNDQLGGGSGNDSLYGGSGHDKLSGGSGRDTLKADAGNDTLHGGSGNDVLWGGSGKDRLYGEAGNDTLRGEAGDDWIVGGLGRDRLWGGSGSDTFAFHSVQESRVGAQRDVIHDFQSGWDKIDLRKIDADVTQKGNQAFTWTGAENSWPFLYPHEAAGLLSAGFTGRAGELRYEHGILMGDVNGDGRADFEIKIVGFFARTDVLL